MRRWFRRNSSLIAALLIFAGASAAAVVAYAKLLDRTEKQRVSADSLALGTHEFVAVSHGRCVGELTVALKLNEEKIAMEGKGSLTTRVGNQLSTTTIKTGAQFNSLLQLGGAFARLKNGPTTVVLGLQNINPMRASLRVSREREVQIEKAVQIPGPLLLREVSEGSYTLLYPHMNSIKDQPRFPALELLAAYDFHVIRRQPGTPQCIPGGALDLSMAAALVTGAASGDHQRLLDMAQSFAGTSK